MDINRLLDIMAVAERMKCSTRHSWTSSGRHESVAEHSWRLCLMAYFVRDEFPELDMDRVLEMCLFHDIGEAFTGDIPAFEKTADNEQTEAAAVRGFVDSLPEYYRLRLGPLFREMEQLATPEARLYKALDKMEAIIQHNEAGAETWLPLEYELNLTYGVKESACSPYLERLRRRLIDRTVSCAPEYYRERHPELM